MPQYKSHKFLQKIPPSSNLYSYILPVGVQYKENWYHAGTCCLLTANLAVTAKHIIEWLYFQVAGKRIDIYDPDLKDPKHGYIFQLPPGIGIDVFQLHHKEARRFAVLGFYRVGFKDTDLIILRLNPHPECPFVNTPVSVEAPVFDLIPPKVGLTIRGFGYPDHPKYSASKLPKPDYSDYYLYTAEGTVEAIYSEVGSAPRASFQTSMKTQSGMSGGPVVVTRNDELVCCGIISSGGKVDYSLITPIWTVAGGQIHPVTGMPNRYGGTSILDLMQAGQIGAIGAQQFALLDHNEGKEFSIVCNDTNLLRTGY